MSSSFFVNNGGSTEARGTIEGQVTDATNAKEDAEKLTNTPHNTQYTLSDGTTTGYSALHYKTEATSSAGDASSYASTASGQASDALDHANDSLGHANDSLGYANDASGYANDALGHANDALSYKNSAESAVAGFTTAVGTNNTTTVETFTATTNQTSFSLANQYTVGANALDIYVNGVLQRDYVETNDQTVTFNNGLTSGDEVVLMNRKYNTNLGLDDNATSTAVTIDSSGNVLVGKTSSSGTVAGCELRESGYGVFTRSGGNPVQVRRLTDDGTLVDFLKDTTAVGSIAATIGLIIGTGDTGLGFQTSTSDAIIPQRPDTLAGRDGRIDLGNASYRFDDIYATNGTIQTSDENEKQDIEALSEAEQRVAVACKGLLRKFRWKSAVEEKGDDARIHFGIIAQDLQAAFEAEGLDAHRYAMFISSTWTDEDTGEEKTRLGVRYSELLAFIIGAM